MVGTTSVRGIVGTTTLRDSENDAVLGRQSVSKHRAARCLCACAAALLLTAIVACDPTPRAREFFGMSGTRENPAVLVNTCNEKLLRFELFHKPTDTETDGARVWAMSWTGTEGNIVATASEGATGGTVDVPFAGRIQDSGKYLLKVYTSRRDGSAHLPLQQLSPDVVLVAAFGDQPQVISPAQFQKETTESCKK